MNTGTGPLLRSGNIKDYTPLGEEGNPVYKWATQIRVSIKRKINSESINVFAIPQPNENGDVIDWYAPEPGPVIPWSSATREEKVLAKEQLSQIQQQLINTGEELNKAEQSEQSVFTRLLEHVIQFPDDEHVYLVNGKPVLTFWGFVDSNANIRPDPLAVLAIPDLPGSVESIPIHEHVVETLPVKRRFSWWWLLPFLLLLLLLLYFLRGCDEVTDFPILQDTVTPAEIDVVPEEDSLVTLPADRVRHLSNDSTIIDSVNSGKGFNNSALPVDQGVIDPGADILPEGLATNEIQDPAVPEPETIENPEAIDNPEEPVSPESATDSDAPVEPEVQPEKPENKLDSPEHTENNKPLGDKPPMQQPLEIPAGKDQKKSMNFLNGRWEADSGLMDKQGRPVKLEYDFKDGKGNVRIKKNDGTICSGTVDAEMEGSELKFSDNGVIKCPDGNSYQPAKVNCKVDSNKQTVCQGAYSGGESFNIGINKSTEPEK